MVAPTEVPTALADTTIAGVPEEAAVDDASPVAVRVAEAEAPEAAVDEATALDETAIEAEPAPAVTPPVVPDALSVMLAEPSAAVMATPPPEPVTTIEAVPVAESTRLFSTEVGTAGGQNGGWKRWNLPGGNARDGLLAPVEVPPPPPPGAGTSSTATQFQSAVAAPALLRLPTTTVPDALVGVDL